MPEQTNMRSFGGSPRTPRRGAAYLNVGRASSDGIVLDIVEYGHGGKPYETGILLTDDVRREVIRCLGGTPDAAESDKLREMARVIDGVIAHYHEYDLLDEEWLVETSHQLRKLAG